MFQGEYIYIVLKLYIYFVLTENVTARLHLCEKYVKNMLKSVTIGSKFHLYI